MSSTRKKAGKKKEVRASKNAVTRAAVDADTAAIANVETARGQKVQGQKPQVQKPQSLQVQAPKSGADLPHAHHMAWYHLLRAHAAVNEQMARRMAAAGHIPPQWYDVLVTLEKAPDARLRMSELADHIILSRSGLTRLVDRLESVGLLRREGCPGDRRGAFAVLTEAGRAAREEAWPQLSGDVMELFARHLNEQEAQTLMDVLSRVADAASQTNTSSPNDSTSLDDQSPCKSTRVKPTVEA